MNFKITSRNTGKGIKLTLTALKNFLRANKDNKDNEIILKNSVNIEGSKNHFNQRPCIIEVRTYHNDAVNGRYYTLEQYNLIMVD